MSIYIIKPEVSSSFIKVGKTKKTSKDNVHIYLYERYRTTYGKKLIAYAWECKAMDYNEMERIVFNRFKDYKVDGSEIFKGRWIFDKVFKFNCQTINREYLVYTEGELTNNNYGSWCLLQ